MNSDADGIVLVHGGEHGSWSWERVVERLRWPAIAVDLPGRPPAPDAGTLELADMATSLAATIRQSGLRRVLLVAHSMGGLAVLAASGSVEDVIAQRVFISSLVPRSGTRGVDALSAPFRLLLLARLLPAARRRRAVLLLPKWVARRKFCSDLSPGDAAMVLQRRCPEPAGIPLTVVDHRPLATAPDVYVVLRRDRALLASRQRQMAANLAGAVIIELDAGHEVMLSDPDTIANTLNALADARLARP